METIHSLLLVLNDDDDQTDSTRLSLLEQLGQASDSVIAMIDDGSHANDHDLDMVGGRESTSEADLPSLPWCSLGH